MRIVLIAIGGFEKKHAAKEGNEYESILEAHCSHFSKYRFSVDENRVLLLLVAGSQLRHSWSVGRQVCLLVR